MIWLQQKARQDLGRLFEIARREDWRGWDPYDALASSAVRRLAFSSRWLRIVWIQLVKRCPINLRPWLGVPKQRNPKALALFASAAFQSHDPNLAATVRELLQLLLSLRAQRVPGFAWGYPFDWQSRAFFAPAHTPNVIVTTFCGQAFLDGFESTNRSDYLEAAQEACRFIREGLNRTEKSDSFCFSYTPTDHSCIHNANLLAAALLCRAGALSQRNDLIEDGLRSARYSLAAQRADGSWFYGESPNQRWIDGFHTGFNLMALRTILDHATSSEPVAEALRRGLDFYTAHFILPDGTPRYYSNKTEPIDIHSAAQAILTLLSLSPIEPALHSLAEKVLLWTFAQMHDETTGRFYFQKRRFYTIRTPFLRWSDAWMARALTAYIHPLKVEAPDVAYAAS